MMASTILTILYCICIWSLSLAYLCAGDAHGEPHVSGLEGGGVVGAVTRHTHHLTTVRAGLDPFLQRGHKGK